MVQWTEWYVIHSYRNGKPRLAKKPTGHEVEGGAGSVSNEVSTRYYDTGRIDSRNVIRFPTRWARKHEAFLSRHYTLKEFEKAEWKKENPDQSGLDQFIGVDN